MACSLQKIWSKLTRKSEHRRRFRRPGSALTPRRAELLSIPPHNRGGRFQANAHGAALVDERTLSSNSRIVVVQLDTPRRSLRHLYR